MKFELVDIKKKPFFDTHIHSVGHGSSQMKNFSVQNVLNFLNVCKIRGLKMLCLSEHMPLPSLDYDPTPDKDCGLEYASCIDVLIKNRDKIKKYSEKLGIKLAIGGEFDFFEDNIEFYDKLDKEFNSEIKVFGQHFIDTINVSPDQNSKDCFGQKIRTSKEKYFCYDFSYEAFAYAAKQKGGSNLAVRYFELLKLALNNQKYDSVAHLDLINKYNAGDAFFVENDSYKKNVLEVLDIMKEKNIALEINLGGTLFTQRLVPRDWIILQVNMRKIPITIGSDAHTIEEIDFERWDFTYDLLIKIGIEKIAIPEIIFNS